MIKNTFIFFVPFVFLTFFIESQGCNLVSPALTSGNEVYSMFSEFKNDYQENDFTISPNPGKNRLNITLPAGMSSAKVSVFNILGKVVYSGEISNFNGTINISNWNSGVYLVKVSINDVTKTKRFIKQ